MVHRGQAPDLANRLSGLQQHAVYFVRPLLRIHLHDGVLLGRGTPFLVLERIPGLSLAQWCRKPGPTAHDIVLVFHRLLGAFGELNDRGMGYPGMTCGDVMIRNGTHSPVVVDLGGVVSYGRPLTKQELSQDIQAAGVMLYEVLTHQRPGPHALPPHVINPRVPRELSELTMRLL